MFYITALKEKKKKSEKKKTKQLKYWRKKRPLHMRKDKLDMGPSGSRPTPEISISSQQTIIPFHKVPRSSFTSSLVFISEENHPIPLFSSTLSIIISIPLYDFTSILSFIYTHTHFDLDTCLKTLLEACLSIYLFSQPLSLFLSFSKSKPY